MAECREKGGITAANSQVFSKIAFDLVSAVERAMTTPQLDNLARVMWRAYSESLISIQEAEWIENRISALRLVKKAFGQGMLPLRLPAPLRRLPDPSERIARRRRIAASGAIPAVLACHYTACQLAVVSAIVGLLRENRVLEKTLQEIADIVGVCRKTVQRTLVIARSLSHLDVQQRRVSKNRNLPHRISIGGDPLLRKWIAFRGGRGTAGTTHKNQEFIGKYCEGQHASRTAIFGPTRPACAKTAKVTVDRNGLEGLSEGKYPGVGQKPDEPLRRNPT